MSLEPITVDLAAVGFQEASGLPAMSAPGEALTVTTRCDRLLAFWHAGSPVRGAWGFKLDGSELDMTRPVKEGTPPILTGSTLAVLPAAETGTLPEVRTQSGDVAGTLDTMGPGTGQAEKAALVYPDQATRLGVPQRSALERGDVPIPEPVLFAASTFSGVGGLDRGLELAGICSVLQAEQDDWCQQVLSHRFRHATQVSDVRNVDAGHVEAALARWQEEHHEELPQGDESGGRGRSRQGGTLGGDGPRSDPGSGSGRGAGGRSGAPRIDLLHGGFPCQDVSVAGRRAGLDGARTGLFFEFARIAAAIRPAWVLLENVPGLLTSNGGRDFGVILDTLADLGYGCAWRVLDSRYFGVPQRRRRVFIVGRLGGDGASALRALCESCSGSAQASACSWQTPSLRARAGAQGDGGADPGSGGADDAAAGAPDVARALTSNHAGTATSRDGGDDLVSGPLLGGGAERGYRLGAEESACLVPTEEEETWALGSHSGTDGEVSNSSHESGGPVGLGITHEEAPALRAGRVQAIAHTLTSGGADASEDGTGRGTPLIPSGRRTRYFDWQKAGGHAMGIEDELAGSLGTTRTPAVIESGLSATLQAKRGNGGGGLGPEETLLPVPLSSDVVSGRSGDAETPSPDADGNVRLRAPGLGVGEPGGPSFTVPAAGPPGVWAVQPDGDEVGGLKAGRVDVAPTLDATAEARSTDRGVRVRAASGVRRLTPVECERLQGFPDGWTKVPGVKCPDSRRYAAMGNAVTVNVAEWIGRRIVAEHLASLES